MYCSSCGVIFPGGLSYCNRCGAELKQGNNKASEVAPGTLVWAIVTVICAGLLAILCLMAMLGQRPQYSGPILAFAFMSILLVLGAAGVFLWLLLRTGGSAVKEKTLRLDGSTTKELQSMPAAALPEPGTSVIDHTTRTLDPVPRLRKE